MGFFGIFSKKKHNPPISSARSLFSGNTPFIQEVLDKTLSIEEILNSFDYSEATRQKVVRFSRFMYQRNEFARGIIDKYVGKIISNGFVLESCPNEKILTDLGIKSEDITEAMFDIEAVFSVWKDSVQNISVRKKWNLSEISRIAERESLVLGDVLIFVQIEKNGFPVIELIGGNRIVTPPGASDNVVYGVELDETGAETAYYVLTLNNEYERIPAYSKTTGRRQAWLLRASDGTCESVRGMPFLEVIIRSLHRIESSYKSEQAAMDINAKLALARHRGQEQSAFDDEGKKALAKIFGKTLDDKTGAVTNAPKKDFIDREQTGFIIANLEHDEKIESFDTKRPNLDVPQFIMDVVKTSTRAIGIPPEVFLMEYNTSYSASTNAKR
ncbi:MAG: phage portal protein [Chitinivibrionia bacterium]|nr:phage portal protein [Chitinivibrionia bacterium]